MLAYSGLDLHISSGQSLHLCLSRTHSDTHACARSNTRIQLIVGSLYDYPHHMPREALYINLSFVSVSLGDKLQGPTLLKTGLYGHS